MELKLPCGRIVLFDSEDEKLIGEFKWHSLVLKRNIYAAGKKTGKRSEMQVTMHRVIMGLNFGDKLEVDHINGNGLDNRRSNLRLVTHSQNIANGRPRNGRRYIGVSFRPTKNKWRGYVMKNGKQYTAGHFDTEEEAAKARDKLAIELFGEYAKLNFASKGCLN